MFKKSILLVSIISYTAQAQFVEWVKHNPVVVGFGAVLSGVVVYQQWKLYRLENLVNTFHTKQYDGKKLTQSSLDSEKLETTTLTTLINAIDSLSLDNIKSRINTLETAKSNFATRTELLNLESSLRNMLTEYSKKVTTDVAAIDNKLTQLSITTEDGIRKALTSCDTIAESIKNTEEKLESKLTSITKATTESLNKLRKDLTTEMQTHVKTELGILSQKTDKKVENLTNQFSTILESFKNYSKVTTEATTAYTNHFNQFASKQVNANLLKDAQRLFDNQLVIIQQSINNK